MNSHQSRAIPTNLGHSSRLPSFLYPLSFVPPIVPPWKSPKAFVSHPWTLYGIGTIGAGLAAAYLPFAQYLCGTYWMPGITDLSTSASTREQVGSKAATYEAGILCASLVGFFTWFCCCESTVYSLDTEHRSLDLHSRESRRHRGKSHASRLHRRRCLPGRCLL